MANRDLVHQSTPAAAAAAIASATDAARFAVIRGSFNGSCSRTGLALIFVFGLLAGGCGPEQASPPLGPITGTFAVSDYFSPSGHMGDGQNLGFLQADVQTNCKSRPSDAKGHCYNFTYVKRGEVGWAGVYWVYPANNWGSREGIRVENGKAFKQVRFKAAASVPVRLTVRYGGVNDLDQPHKDSVLGFDSQMIGEEWTQFRMEVFVDDSAPLTNLIGAFAWAMKYPDGAQDSPPHFPNGDEPVSIYFDDIVWDTEPLPVGRQ